MSQQKIKVTFINKGETLEFFRLPNPSQTGSFELYTSDPNVHLQPNPIGITKPDPKNGPTFVAYYPVNDYSSYNGEKIAFELIGGGSSKKLTAQRVMHGGRKCAVYKGARGGKYIKKNGKFVSLKSL